MASSTASTREAGSVGRFREGSAIHGLDSLHRPSTNSTTLPATRGVAPASFPADAVRRVPRQRGTPPARMVTNAGTRRECPPHSATRSAWHAIAEVNRIRNYATLAGETPSYGGPFASPCASRTAIPRASENARVAFREGESLEACQRKRLGRPSAAFPVERLATVESPGEPSGRAAPPASRWRP